MSMVNLDFKCSNISSLNLNRCPLFYQKSTKDEQKFYNVFKRWKPEQISNMLNYLRIVI